MVAVGLTGQTAIHRMVFAPYKAGRAMNAVLGWLLRLSAWSGCPLWVVGRAGRRSRPRPGQAGSFTDIARAGLRISVAELCLALLAIGRSGWDGHRRLRVARESAGHPDSPRGPPRWSRL